MPRKRTGPGAAAGVPLGREHDFGSVWAAFAYGAPEPEKVQQPAPATPTLRCASRCVDGMLDGAGRFGHRVEFLAQPVVDDAIGVLTTHSSAPCAVVVAAAGGDGGRVSASSAARSEAMARWKRERAVPAGMPSEAATASSGMSR